MARRRGAVTSGRRGGRSGRATAARAGQANVAEHKNPEMSSPASSPAPSPPKRNPRKAAPRGKWSEELLLTSDKSVLIDADLVKLLARPEAWDILEEDEKREILALLPADTHPASELPPDSPSAKIPPLPESFVRYSNNWRDGIRQFQLDLQNGHFDPEWLREAENARRKREKGDFDSFKEREFEKFWGQKQRTGDSVMSGESSKVKLTQLIEAGVFLVGDVWRFCYVYGKGPDRVIIDKETRIHEINDRKLSFIIPTGQRVFLRSHAVTAEPKKEAYQDNDYDMEKSPKNEVIMTEASEPEPLKEEPPTNNKLEKMELQPMEGVHETYQSPKLEDTGAETKQEDFVNGEALKEPDDTQAKPHNENGTVQVVIVSPRQDPSDSEKGFKRPTPLPAAEPPAKRKRGRPRKIRPPSPGPEAEPEAEAILEPEPELKLQQESGVQVVIGNIAIQRTEQLLEITLPGPSPLTRPLSSSNHDTMDLVEQKYEGKGPMSSPLSQAQSILISSPLPEQPKELIDDSTEERREEHTIVPSEKLIERPSEEPTNEHAEQPMHEPTKEVIEECSEELAEEHNAEHTEAPAEEPTQPPSEVQTAADGPDEIIVPEISSPMVLVREILQIDGRRPDGRTANSWKEIRCYRKNQDMGSLFDVRQAWYLKQN